MPKVKIIQNPNFPKFWTVENTKTEDSEEIEGKSKAVRVAFKIAKRLGEDQIIVASNRSWDIQFA